MDQRGQVELSVSFVRLRDYKPHFVLVRAESAEKVQRLRSI